MAIKLKNSDDSKVEVYGNENFGIPKDCTKKQRFSSLKLAFYIVAVAAICITGYKYYTDTVDYLLPEITYDRTKQPLVYNTTSGVVLKTQNGKNFELGNIAVNNDLSAVIRSVSMGKTIFFLSMGSETKTQDLCYYNINDDSVSVIDTAVSDFKVNSDGKHVVYRKGTSLYFSDLKSIDIVALDVDEYYLNENNQVITYFTKESSAMYTCGTSREHLPELVDEGISKVITPKDDHTNIFYIKDFKLFSKEYTKPKVMLAENISDAIALGDYIYYTTEEAYERSLESFFNDDVKEADSALTLPSGVDFIKEVDGLSFFDEEAFNEANEEYQKKLIRDEIRAYFDDSPIQTEGYSLYCYNDGESELIDTDLFSPQLSHNSNKNILLYKKYDYSSDERPDLSTIDTLKIAIEISESHIAEPLDSDMYLIKESREPFFAFEEYPTNQIEISLDGRYLYCIENDKENKVKSLNRYEIGTSALRNKTLITKNVADFSIDGSDSDAVLIFNGNSLSLYYENTLTQLSENSCRDFFFVDGTLFYYDDYDYAKQRGTLKSIRNGKIHTIDTNVLSFKVRKYNNVSYIKNYNSELPTGLLYIKDGRTLKVYDSFVGAIIN